MRQRAIASEDKEQRRQEILDAAERLFVKHTERMANVAEVAAAAGVAKGTVYLYFPGKEEMLLALHERHAARFFDDFLRLLESRAPLGFDEIFAVARAHFIQAPGRLALTSWCFAMMDREMPVEAAVAFKLRIGARLAAAGTALERHFRTLEPGMGARLMQYSLSMMMGLWQFIHPNERFGRALEKSGITVYMRDFEVEVERALRALWAGTVGPEAPRGKVKRKGAR